MRRHIVMTLVLLAGAAACTGCGVANHYADPTLKGVALEEGAQVVAPLTGNVHVLRIDGQEPKIGGGWPPPNEKRYWIRPGIHTLVVFYNDGSRRSVQNAEMSLVLEKGHRYVPQAWPPKIKDTTTGKWVECRVRVADE